MQCTSNQPRSIVTTALVLFVLCLAVPPHAASPRTLAVLDIRSNRLSAPDLKVLSDRLSTEFFRIRRFTVLERSQIDQILKEQGFQQTGCVSTECAVDAGQLLGVARIVLGRVDQMGSMYSVNLRLVDVATGEVLNAVMEDCTGCGIEDVVLNALPAAVRRVAGAPSPAASTRPPGPAHAAAPRSGASSSSTMATITMGTRSFQLDTREVTQREFQSVMGTNPSGNSACADCPAENVTWAEANTYCQSVGKRLPTRAEWEFAARGSDYGTYTSQPEAYGWFSGNADNRTHPVGTRRPNARGLYDMFGNVYEWTADKEKPASTGLGRVFKVVAGGANDRVRKGGSYESSSPVTVDHWSSNGESYRSTEIGFRCAR